MDSAREPNGEWGFEYALKQAKETHLGKVKTRIASKKFSEER